jgi:hypothetical protein
MASQAHEVGVGLAAAGGGGWFKVCPMRRFLLCACAASLTASASAQQTDTAADLAARMVRIGERVEQFYARARTVTSKETVRLQPLETDFRSTTPARLLVYELRVAWDPPADGALPADASVVRQLLTVNGRPPRPKDEPQCMDPKGVAPDALALLLPHNRDDYEFRSAGSTRVDGRLAAMIDFKSVSSEPPEIAWKGTCVSVSLPGRTRGRLWIDAETDDVMRIDEHLIGLFEFPVPREHSRFGGPVSMVIERADSSIRYRPVTFEDPDETLMLPRSIETMTVWRNAGVNRVRMTQDFSDYRRFVTDGRIVVDDEVR